MFFEIMVSDSRSDTIVSVLSDTRSSYFGQYRNDIQYQYRFLYLRLCSDPYNSYIKGKSNLLIILFNTF